MDRWKIIEVNIADTLTEKFFRHTHFTVNSFICIDCLFILTANYIDIMANDTYDSILMPIDTSLTFQL